nr:methyltransferase domain-containing protein [Leucobacter weissii]
MRCRHFDAGECRSCTLIEIPHLEQLAAKEARCRELLPAVPETAWAPAFGGADRGFRNRVKLVVGGSAGRVTLGILGPDRRGVDLRDCRIQAPGIAAVLPAVSRFLDRTGLAPYDVPARRGELKFVHLTMAPEDRGAGGDASGGELMLRFVVRSEAALRALRSRTGELRREFPRAAVISVNLLPEHKAVLEGEREEVLHGETLPMRLGPVTLHLRPRSFFQTNTEAARELYAQVSAWAVEGAPDSVWDLYCGVGGFALHVAHALREAGGQRRARGFRAGPGAPKPTVLGVELGEAAVDSARRSAREAGLDARFTAADATDFALASASRDAPGLLIVNPPRRGIGPVLADWIEGSGVPQLVYSSCNPESLARDLAAMPAYRVREARVFDMFPHTSHLEVAVRLERSA